MRKRTKFALKALSAVMLSGAILTACQSPAKESTSTSKVTSDSKMSLNMDKTSMATSSNMNKEASSASSNTSEAASKASESVDFESFVNKVDELVKLNWPAMDKVWPGYNYNNHNFIIFHLDENYEVKEAKLLSVTENRKLKKRV